MCRSQADGGRRCHGSRTARATSTSASSPTVQQGPVNIASGDDIVALQVGTIGATDAPPQSGSPVADPTDMFAIRSINIRSGNARVGMQVDTIGEINLSL
jgi:hypothetical protein